MTRIAVDPERWCGDSLTVVPQRPWKGNGRWDIVVHDRDDSYMRRPCFSVEEQEAVLRRMPSTATRDDLRTLGFVND